MFEERPTVESLLNDCQQTLWKLETAITEERLEVGWLDLAQKLIKQAQQLEHQIWRKGSDEPTHLAN